MQWLGDQNEHSTAVLGWWVNDCKNVETTTGALF